MVSRRRVLASLAAVSVGGCLDGGGHATATDAGTDGTGSNDTRVGDPGPAEAGARTPTETAGAEALEVRSAAFDDGQPIPRRYTADGANASPPLSIDGVPTDARSMALVVDDPDAPDPPFTHWLVWAILPATRSIPAGLPNGPRLDAVNGAIQGRNDFGDLGYGGPRPPSDDGPHRYRFTVSALASTVDLEPGATRPALEDAMDGNRLARARLVGTYER